MRTLPRWARFERVKAARIEQIVSRDGSRLLVLEEHLEPMEVDQSWVESESPVVGGYVVVKQDGSLCYSSKEDFEREFRSDHCDFCRSQDPAARICRRCLDLSRHDCSAGIPETGISDPAVEGLCRVAEAVAAARALVEKLDRIHEDQEYRAVWESAQLHRGAYLGPKYEDELQELRERLEDLQPRV